MNENKENNIQTLGLGGSCHWCTEGIFQSLIGVSNVKQGWIASEKPYQEFSEAIILDFSPDEISLQDIIAIHLHSHSCTSEHQLRAKYRSALYFFNADQEQDFENILKAHQSDFDKPILTQVLPFSSFRQNSDQYLNYYQNNPEKPFCKNYITPKLKMLKEKFSKNLNRDALLTL
ncbi:peptide-methionine (S)-S-oxide reductase [Pedobacter sp. UYP30]|uniref:peptide-methionine (S)-S-oxide reductase n=1 Tax=Pedobacter sp. UYP30 TaxID=1756400 RepID=UPI003396EF8C